MPLNPMFPPPRPADVAAVLHQREKEREAIEHDRAVVMYAAERGVDAFHAHTFFAEDQRAGRALAYIRSHPGCTAEQADKAVAAEDANRGRR